MELVDLILFYFSVSLSNHFSYLISEQVLSMQQKKRMMVASAFGEDEKGSRQSHLTVEDLNYLFMAD